MALRYEYKYFVPNSKMNMLRSMIAPFVKYDKFSLQIENHHYTVRSIYFDTPEYNCYFEKVEGIKHRKKYRLRGYNIPENNHSKVFFEIKRKYEDPILKNRAPSEYEKALGMFNGGQFRDYLPDKTKYPLAEENLKRFFYHYHADRLRPVVLVIYEREAFLGLHDETIRVTFDKNLRSVAFPAVDELYQENKVRYALKDSFILEVKFNDHYPAWMKPIISALGVKRQSASKYVISMDTHNFIKPKKLPSIYSRSRIFTNKHYLRNV
ncbi:MAG: polyphosphate polymerase domain-containing protein [Sphingobacteriia bacterium]|nr:polyphosphate polymerase domain-containing protein [Sphingobacteriia bacterium]